MRAKLLIVKVQDNVTTDAEPKKYSESLEMMAVGPKGGYPDDGKDENNSYAFWSPQANFTITIANPALWGKFSVGQEYYADFTLAGDPAPAGEAPGNEVSTSEAPQQ